MEERKDGRRDNEMEHANMENPCTAPGKTGSRPRFSEPCLNCEPKDLRDGIIKGRGMIPSLNRGTLNASRTVVARWPCITHRHGKLTH